MRNSKCLVNSISCFHRFDPADLSTADVEFDLLDIGRQDRRCSSFVSIGTLPKNREGYSFDEFQKSFERILFSGKFRKNYKILIECCLNDIWSIFLKTTNSTNIFERKFYNG